MRSTLLSLVILLSINQLCMAQESGSEWKCHATGKHTGSQPAVAVSAENHYDVKYVKFDVILDNTSIFIKGDVTTRAVSLVPSFNSYVFELDAALIIDSVMINGAQRPVSHAGDIHTVTLSTPLAAGTMFSARVCYHGIPVGSGSTFSGVNGLNNMVSPSWGTRVTFTHSEAYHAKEWWPCKQSLLDKVDSVDMWVTVPDSLKAGSNGVLQRVTAVDATHDRYEWKLRSPVAYYLISISVAPYIDYSYYVRFSGSEDSMLVQNYVYPNPSTLPFFKSEIDSTGMMIDYFSKLYSRYPFWKEKYGHCMAPISGGMENQTMSTMGYFQGWIIAHELGHQWFGDNVTCGTWSDIFVNEGFASYTEDLYLEHFDSKTSMQQDMMEKQANVRRFDTGTIYVTDTADEERIFSSRLTYHKGACLLHMLRHVINNDSTFFHVYRTYQQEYKDRNATIIDFRSAVKSVVGHTINGINIDTFFRQWAYGEGFPVFSAKWNQKGSDVYVQLDQMTKVPASVSCFTLPVEIRLRSSTGDTVVRVNSNQPNELFTFRWSKTLTNVVIDPAHWLLDSVSSVSKDITLAAGQLPVSAVKIYPNPTNAGWNIDGLQENSTLVLTDMAGRVLWQKEAVNGKEAIPAEGLATGLYMLRITSDGVSSAYKLVKE